MLGVAPVWTVQLAALLICIQLLLFRSFCSQKMDVKGQNLRDKNHRDAQRGTASGSHSVGTREKTDHFPLDLGSVFALHPGAGGPRSSMVASIISLWIIREGEQ